MASPTRVIEDSGLWPEVEAAIARNQQALDAAKNFAEEYVDKVVDNGTLQAANTRLRELATFGREIESARKDATGPIAQQKAYADAVFGGAIKAIGVAKGQIDTYIRDYQQEQRRIREAAEAKAQKEAAAERRRKMLLAERATERGDDARAIEHAEAAARVEAKPVLAPEPVKLEGNYDRTTWHAEVFDPLALPAMYLMPNMPLLNKVVGAAKEATNIPGVRAVPDTTSVQRSVR